ncbi:hypothetical protein PENTCL1PPCAC_12078 [Pristionchus entomophagus]|uniref:Uncharacterized protein n=1 Tax=Pristionchus entomophagus TaxID=358040 RepID=A0AAV5T6W6_9BILA|nr:hypothetical protein PENTCL1PPCAC_12078 [Pristionchus entomophagus]
MRLVLVDRTEVRENLDKVVEVHLLALANFGISEESVDDPHSKRIQTEFLDVEEVLLRQEILSAVSLPMRCQLKESLVECQDGVLRKSALDADAIQFARWQRRRGGAHLRVQAMTAQQLRDCLPSCSEKRDFMDHDPPRKDRDFYVHYDPMVGIGTAAVLLTFFFLITIRSFVRWAVLKVRFIRFEKKRRKNEMQLQQLQPVAVVEV